MIAPQLSQPEEQEQDAERVDVAPEARVEPGDGVGDHEGATDQGSPPAGAELASHRPHEPAEPDVREDRRDLDEVADAADRLTDEADDPEDVEVPGRVV